MESEHFFNIIDNGILFKLKTTQRTMEDYTEMGRIKHATFLTLRGAELHTLDFVGDLHIRRS